jgi:ligand-binding SRPBCC domain-containing protein
VKIFEHRSTLWIPRPLAEVFPFFSEARNLELLTPPWLRFEVLTPEPIPMRIGTLIDYRLRVRGIPMRWRSEIAAWDPPHRFVDRQLRGPYRLWDHEHGFAERDGGTEAADHVRYAVWGGTLVDRLVVRRDVAAIFGFREQRLREIFARDS